MGYSHNWTLRLTSLWLLLTTSLLVTTRHLAMAEDDILTTFYTYEPCNVCGADDGEIGNPDTILPAGTAGILNDDITCAQAQAMAAEGTFSPAACLVLPYRIFTTCGCISSEPPPVFPPAPDEDDNGDILGLDRNLFIAIVVGGGVALLMLLALLGSASSNKAPPLTR